MPVKIVHCADFHINSPMSSISEKSDIRRDEVLMTLSSMVDICISEDVQVLLIAGDFFDTPCVPDGVRKAVETQLNRLSIPVFIAAGNHDYYTEFGAYANLNVSDNVHIFKGEPECVELSGLGVRVYGAGFTNSFADEPLMRKIEKPDDELIDVVLLHGDVVTPGSTSQYNPISIGGIAESGADYCALGHIHMRSEISRCGNMSYAYPGCPEGRGFDETGEKGIYIGYIDKGKCELEFRRVCRRVYHDVEVNISECETADAICDIVLNSLPGDGERDLYKITLTGELPTDFEINIPVVENRLREKLYFAKVRNSTRIKLDLNMLRNEVSIRGYFVKDLYQKYEESLANGDRDEAEKYLRAIEYGIRAFEGEVNVFED